MIGLIFDVDGVVGDTEAINAEASVAMFSELYRVTVQPPDFLPFIGMGAQRYVGGVAQKYNVEIDVAAATEKRQENFFAILKQKGLPPYPGVLALMQSAREADDVRLAIATSGAKEKAMAVLAATGVNLSWFDAIVTGSEVTRKKPDPELYEIAIARLKLAPADCIVIEDAPAGIAAARAAGAKVVAVTNTVSATELAQADRVLESLSQLSVEALRQMAP